MWRKVTETDLTTRMSQSEIDAFRRSGDGEHDPVESSIADEVAYVRGVIRSAPSGVKLSADDTTLPESLIGPAMDHLRFNVLTRLATDVNDSRTKAYEQSNALFDQVRRGEFVPESDGTADEAAKPAGSPLSGKPNPPRLLD